jgi:hypothetical protein
LLPCKAGASSCVEPRTGEEPRDHHVEEGQIKRLKLIKRQINGRAKLDPLRA